MNKKLPIYILIIYFIFVILILVLQLAGREERAFVAVGFNDRLNNAVVVYEKSPIMLKKQAQEFINDENTSEKPIVENGITYLPLSFYKNGFDAIISYNKNKDQMTLKYDNKALVMEEGKREAVLSDAQNDKKIALEYVPQVIGGEYYLPVRTFASVFDKELFFDDGLIIISDMKDIFDKETEADSINKVKALVYDLPVAGSYDKTKSLYKEITRAAVPEKLYTRDNAHLYIMCSDNDMVYYAEGSDVIKADNMPYGEHNELCRAFLPEGFQPEGIDLLGEYVCVTGVEGEKAALCIFDMTGSAGILKKHILTEGRAIGIVSAGDYTYFGTLCDGEEELKPLVDTEGYVPVSYEGMRYFAEDKGNSILNVCGINMQDLNMEPIETSYFGVTDQIVFCGSGIYIAQGDDNFIYGDIDDRDGYSNVYKLCFREGETAFENTVRIKGKAEFAAKNKPAFITRNYDDSLNYILLDSLLGKVSENDFIDVSCGGVVWGDERAFLLGEGGAITVIDQMDGENCGSFIIGDTKLYLYNDNRIIGVSETTAEEGQSYPSVSIKMYNISEPSEAHIVSEETIENADETMFGELIPEMGDGVVIIPVKVWEDGSLYEGRYSYIESSYYGLRFNEKKP